jgi:hypothetical protein
METLIIVNTKKSNELFLFTHFNKLNNIHAVNKKDKIIIISLKNATRRINIELFIFSRVLIPSPKTRIFERIIWAHIPNIIVHKYKIPGNLLQLFFINFPPDSLFYHIGLIVSIGSFHYFYTKF